MKLKQDIDKNSHLYKLRHSLAHVMAQAVLEMRPGSKRGFGPPIADGFYYDFDLTEPLTEDDLPEIENRMRKIINQKQEFVQELLPLDAAYDKLEQEMEEPFKREYAAEIAEKQNLSELGFYTNGPFVDMCEGPHMEHTGQIPHNCFKLRSLAGSYWRGDEKNKMFTRVYAWAFEDKKKLNTHIRAYEEAQKRDHKKLGPALDIYTIDDTVGKGLPLWLPNGTVLREELENLAKELEQRAGFHRVATPHITKQQLYYDSGHLPYYEESMYPPMEIRETADDGSVHVERYFLKPMNCPHHHKIYASRMRSYRDLPLRLAEYGQCYRYEDSGALSGLLRVRGLCMNDAHIYCTRDQVKDEFQGVLEMHKTIYELLGINDFYMRFSLSDLTDEKNKNKYVNDPEAWAETEQIVREVMEESGMPYVEIENEAAFYGPKIDFQFVSVTGREETASTCQLDFAVPRADRMNLVYTDSDGTEKHPYIIHRAPLGTHERFIGFLIEHFGGAFPTWLAPLQVAILPIAEPHMEYAEKLQTALQDALVRVEVEPADNTLNKRIREFTTRKVPNILVVGDKEAEENAVTLRQYGRKKQANMPLDEFVAKLQTEIRNRTLVSQLTPENEAQ
jgi:threonyl-tRNA synthetase